MITLLSQVFGAAVVGTPRPAAVFFVVQLGVGIASRLGYVELPAALAWSVSLVAMGFGLAAALLELITQHTDEVEELLRELHLDKLFGGLGSTLSGGLLFAAHTVGDEARREDLAEAVQIVADAGLEPWHQAAIVLAAASVNVGLVWVRAQVLEWLDDLDLKSWWAWLETGGVGVGLLMLWLFPALALALFVLVVAVMAVGVAVGKAAGWAMDRRSRCACPHCEHAVRVEALGCPSCGRPLEPRRVLSSKRPTAEAAQPAGSAG